MSYKIGNTLLWLWMGMHRSRFHIVSYDDSIQYVTWYLLYSEAFSLICETLLDIILKEWTIVGGLECLRAGAGRCNSGTFNGLALKIRFIWVSYVSLAIINFQNFYTLLKKIKIMSFNGKILLIMIFLNGTDWKMSKKCGFHIKN